MEGAEAEPKVERDRSPSKAGKEGGADQNGSRARDARPRRDTRERRPRDGRPPPGRPTGGDRRQRPERRVYVSNIPFEFQWQELKDLFRKEVGDVSFVEVFHDEKGQSRGCGIIEFDSPELVDKALEIMHRYELKGRNIVVKEDFGVERDRYGRILRGDSRPEGPPGRERGMDARRPGPGGFRGGERDERPRLGAPGPPGPPEAKYTNTYGLNVSFLESLGIDGPLVNRVFVANLDYSVDEQKLKEVFSLAGKVVSVSINKDHEGNSKGHGVVEFDHPVEAVQAISMLNNQTYLERRISVRMDRVAERRDRDPKMSLPAGLKSIGQGLGNNGVALADVASKIQETPAPAVAAAAQLGGLGGLAANNAAALGLMALDQGLGARSGLLDHGMGGRGGLLDHGLGSRGGMDAGRGSMDHGLGGRGGMESGMGGRSGMDQGLGGRGGMDAGLGARGGLDSARAGRSSYNSGYGSSMNSGPDSGYNSSSRNYSDSIIVSNLDPAYSWQALRDKFRDIGEVRFADMKGKGVGVVRFSSPHEAQRAINLMDGARCDGRMLDVRSY
ncbi:myelin expression factor 2-like [Pollicipes pollicipes]|uniref:myelin expression factor 2-like n=1 Tax=Pollicipes pollicipes TaxID=41117 RepID=UPI001884AD59|nr:myelin expression factor 2-like [Pollicipes pollicipes]